MPIICLVLMSNWMTLNYGFAAELHMCVLCCLCASAIIIAILSLASYIVEMEEERQRAGDRQSVMRLLIQIFCIQITLGCPS